MTFLPIIERELRVRARSRGTCWLRCGVVLLGGLVCLPPLLWSGPVFPTSTLGQSLLSGLVIIAFVLCCGACLLTADIISAERREGTLGLLLLTDVRGYDILAGKLGSAGLTALCALVAFLPLLMLPVLAGGVTGGEAFRKGLVLPDMLFLALAAGLWASAHGYERLKTTRTALLVVVILLLAPGMLELSIGRSVVSSPSFWLLSPLSALVGAGDATYNITPDRYWTSLILVQATAWALVVSAGFRLRRAWREEKGETDVAVAKSVREGATEPDGPWLSCSWTPPVPSPTGETERAAPKSRPLDDDANPLAWLLERQRGTQAILWTGVLLSLAHYSFSFWGVRFLGLHPSILLNLAGRAIAGALFAWAASRLFVAARVTGELELLLTTPFGAGHLVSAQWSALKRHFRWPMLVMLAPSFLVMVLPLANQLFWQSSMWPVFWLPLVISELLNGMNIIVGVVALCWVGLWFGLRAGGQGRAIAWTLGVVWCVPCLIGILSMLFFASAGAYSLRLGPGQGPGLLWRMAQWTPQMMNLLYYSVLIYAARHRLLGALATGEPMRFELKHCMSAIAPDALAGLRKARHWTPS
ncbi:MAG: ABC transporter permease subunit [Verrucomicrobia bacterium]|nr:ABC transporter permease subunit [Verrucomicrobiota bacterium]